MVQYLLLVLAANMNYSATGSYQRVLGESRLKAMGQTTVSKSIKEVVYLIVVRLSGDWIIFPQTREENMAAKSKFMEKFNFPGLIGAIDCTHVALVAPAEDEQNYVNRKGYHSKNVHVICDSELKIININANFGGAAHDSFIWNQSDVQRAIQLTYNNGDRNSWLLGDSGYPQQPWLMTPYLNPVPGSPQERYNTCHSQGRNVMERCFGVLKGRFRCISADNQLRYAPGKVGTIVIACSILHNICISGRLVQHAEVGEMAEHLVELYFTNE